MRDAGPGDAPAVAALHAASWQSAYRRFASAAYLDGPAAADLLAAWTRALAAPPAGSFVMLDEAAGALRAFISIKLAVEPFYDAFVYALHVDPALRGGGIGRRLLGLAVERLIAQGHRSLALRAFDGNPDGIRFYRRLGGSLEGHGLDEVGGVTFPDTLIGWRDLPALARACR
jgi:GNAT superfamily N-acetyltransferase